jgi:hypothetical protein
MYCRQGSSQGEKQQRISENLGPLRFISFQGKTFLKKLTFYKLTLNEGEVLPLKEYYQFYCILTEYYRI